MRSISIFGATGSIGRSTIKVLLNDFDNFSIDTLVANKDIKGLVECVQTLQQANIAIKHVVIADDTAYPQLKEALHFAPSIASHAGMQAVIAAAQHKVDVMVAGISGMAGLRPIMASIGHCKTLALANKESVVCGGNLLMDAIKNSSTTLIPVDSEHCALFQLLENAPRENIAEVTLTASGGPFLHRKNLADITPAEAVKHPKWSMGQKISIDSATLMNKGLEVIEAAYLFDLAPERIKVLVHPQSIIHAMATLKDGTIFACMGATDMQLPISYALYYPEHPKPCLPPPSLTELSFHAPDTKTFRCLDLAYKALETQQCVTLNAANEKAVELFLQHKISFAAIAEKITQALNHFQQPRFENVDSIIAFDKEVQNYISHAHP